MKNIVSLFNDMSVAEMAFKEILGKNDYKLSYSEVDKHANKVTEVLFPCSNSLGDVRNIEPSSLGVVDYLVGGSPYQSFSFSGKQQGMTTKTKEEILTLKQYLSLKQQGFEFQGQSYLFWEFVRVLTGVQQLNPDVKFLLENVVMSKKWEDVITKALGVAPILINSDLVGGQQRKRLYWTNINDGNISQPEDLGINFRDLLEDDKFTSSGVGYVNKATIVGRRLNAEGKREDYNKKVPITQCIEVRKTNTDKVNCLTTVQKDNIITNLPIGRHIGAFTNYTKGIDWRYLTAREALRLQTIPEQYINTILDTVSENQAYKMAGNGWTLEVIKHILSYDL